MIDRNRAKFEVVVIIVLPFFELQRLSHSESLHVVHCGEV